SQPRRRALQPGRCIVIFEPGTDPGRRKERTMLSRFKKIGLGVAAVSGAAVGGAAVAGAATSGTAATPRQPPPARNMPAPGTASHEGNEKAVTGDAATKAQAAAIKAAGGGTAGDVTTDYFGNGYEVTVTQTDGTKVEIHLDSSFNVMGPPGGGFGGPAPGTAAHEGNEKAVTGDAATKAQAAAVKAAGGGTAGDVTTDYFGNGYEVTVTKTDGTKVEIHLDSSFNVLGPPGGRFGGPPPAASFGTAN
ncbi:MAG TPA: hypothetical protein VKB70_01805, partial [Gaiellaceae bacterium]|nr:hypothetical protein [Gaiellaceae bacterium]